jgi:hypothetical protein
VVGLTWAVVRHYLMTTCRDRQIRRITRSACGNLILNQHYAGRWPSISFAFGLFIDGVLEGVVTYGSPPSAPLRIGIAGAEFTKNVIELNRLVLTNNRKNDASWLVSHSLRMMKKLGNFIVISFADLAQNHIGIVYQACGFTYYGLSAKRTDWKIKGMEHLHGQTVADEFRGHVNRSDKMREKYGDGFYLSPRSRKHRYIRLIGTRGFMARVSKKIKYTREAYPQ